MNTYRIIGETRDLDGGAPEPFEVLECAASSEEAYNAVSLEAFAELREGFRVTAVRLVLDDNQFGVLVEPRAYLPR